MLDGLRSRVAVLVRQTARLARRRRRAFSRWIENTRNLLHLSVLLFLPLLLGIVTALSNTLELLPFLLFPPLASGTYTLFAHPESRYASPRRFVGGLTAGAFCGWLALELAAVYWYEVPPGEFSVHAGAVAFGMFLTGVVTWALDIEEASAFSSALLIHLVDVSNAARLDVVVAPGLSLVIGPRLGYVFSVALSTALVASLFLLWREHFYEHREHYLYRSTKGNDSVLVPVRGDTAGASVMLAARLAAVHESGKVVLLDVVDDGDAARSERERLDAGGVGPSVENEQVVVPDERETTEDAATEAAKRLESLASSVETKVGVPCEVVVAAAGATTASTIEAAVAETGCDLIVVPYEEQQNRLAPFIRELFRAETDVLVHRSNDGRTHWKRVLVSVRRAGDVAHAMIDFAARLARRTGEVSLCHCIGAERERREAETMLADLAETVDIPVETRVSRSDVAEFIAATAPEYDLVVIGASTDRPATQRFIHRPTFERLEQVDADVAILDRNF
ncbi:MAG: HPP family protein [Haloarculaceae archaeon]